MASLLDLAQARLGGLLVPQRPSMAGLLGGRQQTGTLAGALQGYTPPQMTAMTNPQVMDYARNVAQSAQQNLQTQMSDLDKALVMDQGGINVGDRQALARLMEQIPGLMGATAYHGTPHTIRGKFDISKVGTGEGAQAYGHGMYFAESPKTAEYYKDLSKNILYTPEGQPFNFAYELSHPNVRATLNKTKDVDSAIQRAKQLIENKSAADVAQKDLQILENLKNKGGLQEGSGNLYKVDIPDADIPMMLDWDKPLNQQSDAVKKALGMSEDKFENFRIPATGTNYGFSPNMTGSELYRELTSLAKTQAEASKLMNTLGIKGIRYLDEGSRSAGKGTSNFVVFDPKDVKILEKNNQKVEGLLD
jgi:hypothetical protein